MTKISLHTAGTWLDYEGSEAFLEGTVLPLLDAATRAQFHTVTEGVLGSIRDLEELLVVLDRTRADLAEADERLAHLVQDFRTRQDMALDRLVAADLDATAIESIAAEMRELNRSFSMQYLLLQEKMQRENREISMISNIMKTKHETVGNSIDNVR